MQPHSKRKPVTDAALAKESKSAKPANRRSSTKPETTSSHSDFQPPSSQVPRASQAQSIVRRTPTSSEAKTQSQKGKHTGTTRRDLDSTPAPSNASPALRTKVRRKASKTTKTLPPVPSNMDSSVGHQDPFQSTEIWEGPLGSFGESDSPPRGSLSGHHDNRPMSMHPSPRGSPSLSHYQYMHYSDYSTPYGQDREWHQRSMSSAHAISGHPHGRPYQQGHYPNFYENDPVWHSPPPVEDSFGASGRSSPLTRPRGSGMAMTPNKKSNPFRSPPSKSLNRSPLGLSSSFGMVETPDPQLADAFSPVGPAFVWHHPKISLTRSSSGEIDPPPLPQRSSTKDSPLGFLNEFINAPSSGALQGVARSPIRKASKLSASRSTGSSVPRIATTTSLQASPVLPSSEVKPTKLWNDGSTSRQMPSVPRNAMRLELGQFGAKSSRTQQSFEGINNMMRASSAAHHSAQAYRTPFAPHMYGQPHQPQRYATQPGPFQHSYSTATPKIQITSSSATPIEVPKLIPPSTGKPLQKNDPTGEESSTKETDSEKRICNCRKSKCLMLYCECFSAKAYCNGCKCADCHNLPQFGDLREKAIKNARTKNPSAFQKNEAVCRCKKSACLKKYCECFCAGDFCGPGCKCLDCENRAGSQKLIDKRRKMKDSKGTEYAVRVAHEVWQGHRSQQASAASPANTQSMNMPTGTSHGRHPLHMQPGGMPHPGYLHPAYMASSVMGRMGYSPMGVPPVTPLYGQQHRAHEMHLGGMMHHYNPEETKPADTKSAPSKKRSFPDTSPPTTTSKGPVPRTPPVRIEFDPSSSRKKSTKKDSLEERLAMFGKNKPEQPKRTVLNILSFLTNADLYSATIVSKEWCRVAMDRELWEYSSD